MRDIQTIIARVRADLPITDEECMAALEHITLLEQRLDRKLRNMRLVVIVAAVIAFGTLVLVEL